MNRQDIINPEEQKSPNDNPILDSCDTSLRRTVPFMSQRHLLQKELDDDD